MLGYQTPSSQPLLGVGQFHHIPNLAFYCGTTITWICAIHHPLRHTCVHAGESQTYFVQGVLRWFIWSPKPIQIHIMNTSLRSCWCFMVWKDKQFQAYSRHRRLGFTFWGFCRCESFHLFQLLFRTAWTNVWPTPRGREHKKSALFHMYVIFLVQLTLKVFVNKQVFDRFLDLSKVEEHIHFFLQTQRLDSARCASLQGWADLEVGWVHLVFWNCLRHVVIVSKQTAKTHHNPSTKH